MPCPGSAGGNAGSDKTIVSFFWIFKGRFNAPHALQLMRETLLLLQKKADCDAGLRVVAAANRCRLVQI
jgi:hypothetical protein